MANPWPRETFVIPGDAGQVARTINMIKVDDAFRTQLLTIFNGATSDQGPNTMIKLPSAVADDLLNRFYFVIQYLDTTIYM